MERSSTAPTPIPLLFAGLLYFLLQTKGFLELRRAHLTWWQKLGLRGGRRNYLVASLNNLLDVDLGWLFFHTPGSGFLDSLWVNIYWHAPYRQRSDAVSYIIAFESTHRRFHYPFCGICKTKKNCNWKVYLLFQYMVSQEFMSRNLQIHVIHNPLLFVFNFLKLVHLKNYFC